MRLASTLLSLSVLLAGLLAALASAFSDPRLVAGAECCACLQQVSPEGEQLASTAYDLNCLPGDSEETETCSDEVASQIVEDGEGDAVRVLSAACHEEYCADECASAKENGVFFATTVE